MVLLTGAQSKSLLKDWSSSAQSRIWVCSAYIKSFSLQDLFVDTGTRNVSVVARWSLFDLVQGSSDIEAAEWAISKGFEFWVNPRLHAKACLIDEHSWLGSANISRRGMPESDYGGNIEINVGMPENESLELFFRNLFAQSVKLSSDDIENIKHEIAAYKKDHVILCDHSSLIPKTIENIIAKAKLRKFYSSDLPWCQSPSDLIFGAVENENVRHDLEFLGLLSGASLSDIRIAFKQTRILEWLKSCCNEEQRFGSLTKQLHNLLHDEPRPYRKDVKRLLSNLLQWAEELYPDNFNMYVPGRRSVVVKYKD